MKHNILYILYTVKHFEPHINVYFRGTEGERVANRIWYLKRLESMDQGPW